MDYIDAATSGTLSPHILTVTDLQDVVTYIRYLTTYIAPTCLLLIDVPIQDRS